MIAHKVGMTERRRGADTEVHIRHGLEVFEGNRQAPSHLSLSQPTTRPLASHHDTKPRPTGLAIL